MRIYICSVCGFDYDEAKGDPGSGIAPGTKWEDVPEDWVCPICGADKSMFKMQGGQEEKPAPVPSPAAKPRSDANANGAKRNAILSSNLAKGASKQFRLQLSEHLTALADYFEARSEPEGDMSVLVEALNEDAGSSYPAAFEQAKAAADRGALRALTWGEKVTGIQRNLLSRYQKDGDKILEGANIFVCDACGFIFLGEEAPEICPVCKVPRFKFNQIKKEA